jgi:hypothetical protein
MSNAPDGDSSQSVSVGQTRNAGHLTVSVDRGFTGSPELPPNPERLIDLLETRGALSKAETLIA